jgi:hypothetical protein
MGIAALFTREGKGFTLDIVKCTVTFDLCLDESLVIIGFSAVMT